MQAVNPFTPAYQAPRPGEVTETAKFALAVLSLSAKESQNSDTWQRRTVVEPARGHAGAADVEIAVAAGGRLVDCERELLSRAGDIYEHERGAGGGRREREGAMCGVRYRNNNTATVQRPPVRSCARFG